jgi:transcriptional regulator with XRE-family HTH domain
LDYNKIKILSLNKNIAIKDIAEKIGISEAGIHQMIRNNSMKIEYLEKIAEVLGVPVSFFFEDKEYSDKVEEEAVFYGKMPADLRDLEIKLAVALARNEELRGQVEYFRKLYEKAIEDKNKPDTKQ